jgi:hypothetical protein
VGSLAEARAAVDAGCDLIADSTGTIEAFAMYAGTSVGSIDRVEPVADVVARLASDAVRHLSELSV